MTLADRLKTARESTGKSQKEMAFACNASYRMWQAYEMGENPPSTKVIESLARMGFNANWLLTGEGEMKVGIQNFVVCENNSEAETYTVNGESKSNYSWFHEWIDEELRGKNMSEVMAIAVKIKTVLDNK